MTIYHTCLSCIYVWDWIKKNNKVFSLRTLVILVVDKLNQPLLRLDILLNETTRAINGFQTPHKSTGTSHTSYKLLHIEWHFPYYITYDVHTMLILCIIPLYHYILYKCDLSMWYYETNVWQISFSLVYWKETEGDIWVRYHPAVDLRSRVNQ